MTNVYKSLIPLVLTASSFILTACDKPPPFECSEKTLPFVFTDSPADTAKVKAFKDRCDAERAIFDATGKNVKK